MCVHVAAAVVVNQSEEVLIAKRPAEVHQGGLWEFPGGKLEAGETVEQALARELLEETGIHVERARPLIRVHYDYGDKSVLLDVWRVEAFRGEAHGREGQPVMWVRPEQFASYTFPAANRPILRAASLPDRYLITPEPAEPDMFLQQLDRALARGIRLVQFRAKKLEASAWQALAAEVIERCHRAGARCLLNTSPAGFAACPADGMHLDSRHLHAHEVRPVPTSVLLSASCHNEADIRQAETLGADFIVLSPVQATASHPDAEPLGWERFHEMSDKAAMPVFALGGMRPEDLETAFAHGAQGIAAIRALWGIDDL
ncbi:Nudix family hydrolase [Sulfuriflexus sp.]|uniref:Nudix family hydrolase n=1 Tax=Sulfuriflexus sp. TaxID=2015443 RepID=UPI0028CC1D7E|nr:Nudix family hydrolase [Sulfuriflexus sp.]MDT8404332.1 Nudix family hydrolase [Sulfuriflexus sp.]